MFLLLWIPGIEAAHVWISIPFCLLYLLAVMENCALVLVIKTDPSLHESMYLFLCMFSVKELLLCSTLLPKICSLFWFNDSKINFKDCLIQIFFIHSLSTMESDLWWSWPLTSMWPSETLWETSQSWHLDNHGFEFGHCPMWRYPANSSSSLIDMAFLLQNQWHCPHLL